MKRAAPVEDVVCSELDGSKEIQHVLVGDEKRIKMEDEVCLDGTVQYEDTLDDDGGEGGGLHPPPHYQNLIIQHMDIAEPLSTLRQVLESRLQCSLSDHNFFLQDDMLLDSSKSLVEQCVQGDGMVQINLEVKSQPGVEPKINIVDILKSQDDLDLGAIKEEVVEQMEIVQSPTVTLDKVVVPAAEEAENFTRWVVDQAFRKDQERLNIPFDPVHWTEVHVKHWIQWAVREFSLFGVDVGSFSMDGKALCRMPHPEFVRYIPHDPGDIFWTHLELLRKCKFVAVMQQPVPQTIATITIPAGEGRRLKNLVRYRPRLPRVTGEERMSPGNRTGNNGQIQLWQFLLELLTDKDCCEVIHWVGAEGEFKLSNPELVANLWGQRKNKPTMNYEKLSRALRYYYDGDMISKVHGKRFVYKFVCDLKMLLGYSAAELSRQVTQCAEKQMLSVRGTVTPTGTVLKRQRYTHQRTRVVQTVN